MADKRDLVGGVEERASCERVVEFTYTLMANSLREVVHYFYTDGSMDIKTKASVFSGFWWKPVKGRVWRTTSEGILLNEMDVTVQEAYEKHLLRLVLEEP